MKVGDWVFFKTRNWPKDVRMTKIDSDTGESIDITGEGLYLGRGQIIGIAGGNYTVREEKTSRLVEVGPHPDDEIRSLAFDYRTLTLGHLRAFLEKHKDAPDDIPVTIALPLSFFSDLDEMPPDHPEYKAVSECQSVEACGVSLIGHFGRTGILWTAIFLQRSVREKSGISPWRSRPIPSSVSRRCVKKRTISPGHPMKLTPPDIQQARRHLRARDPVMRSMIDAVGPYTLRFDPDRFGLLVRSIISQQISTIAARAIRKRLLELAGPDGLTAANLSRFTTEELRSVGLSPQKASYVADLATKVNDGTVDLRRIGRLSDERVVETLTQVKGIGRWTAQMFLIFSLGRPDVFPHDDLGVRTAIRDRYGLEDLPDKKTSHAIAAPWRPYASVASWYCWRTLDLARNTETVATGYPS